MSQYKSIIVFGAPGCGKGTQGAVLGRLPRFFHFACGDVFRSLDTRSDLGKQFVQYSSKGQLVPDELTVKLWKVQIENKISAYVFKPDIDILVLDGIPRNVSQAKLIEKYIDVVQVIHLKCDNHEELKRRIRKRAIKENRFDDGSDKIIEERFEIYNNETKLLLDYYSEDKIAHINAMNSAIHVVSDVIDVILKNDSIKK